MTTQTKKKGKLKKDARHKYDGLGVVDEILFGHLKDKDERMREFIRGQKKQILDYIDDLEDELEEQLVEVKKLVQEMKKEL